VKILLVDDDPVARSIHSMLLQTQGHEVLEASDGELAWQLLQKSEVSFVVSDWVMPNLAGVDLCRRIRAERSDRYVYVILCTAKEAKADLIEGMDAGADDFLVKPINPEELRVKVWAGERVLSLQLSLGRKNAELVGINARLEIAHRLIQDDLRAAAWMQQRLLPPPSPEAHGVRCEWSFHPSGYIAGDIFNFFALDEQRVGFYLLDVSGHGVPAAMLSVTLSMMLTPDGSRGSPLKRYNPSTGGYDVLPPGDAVRELNRRFQSKDDQYFTMIYGVFDVRSSMLRLAQAGHPGPILLGMDGSLRVLGTGGMPMGLWREIDFDCVETLVKTGDRLLLYSDGITECMNAEGEAFGEGRLIGYLKQRVMQPLRELLDGLLAEIKTWRGQPDFGDDLSLLAIDMDSKG
jgi:sigma-B regulation protein RsbU (phosphoserine phosphatase)